MTELKTYADRPAADCVKTYAMSFDPGRDENGVRIYGKDGTADAGELLDRQVRSYQHDHPELSYREAWERVAARPENWSLIRAYSSVDFRPTPVPLSGFAEAPAPTEQTDLSAEIDGLVREHMSTTGSSDYAASLGWVLSQNSDLRRAYGEPWE